MLPPLEVLILGLWLAFAVIGTSPPRRPFGLARMFRRLACHRAMATAFVGALAFVLAAAVSWLRWPEPQVHDEFSYLLLADTFLHGRLANPAHPLALYFDTFHVNQYPVYCSMYPPAPGLVIALGWALFGFPLAGAWLGFALASAALCWMLQAWLPPRWALAGALLALGRVGCLGKEAYWRQSFWGGAVPMLGGALVLGAARRIVDKSRVRDAVILAIGLAILANSRPFEGLILSASVAVLLAGWLVCDHAWSLASKVLRIVLPCAAVLAAAACLTGYYNAQITGRPTLMPYAQNNREYGMAPLFIWQPPSPEPIYNHAVIRAYHMGWAVPAYQRERTVSGYVRTLTDRLRGFLAFYLGPLLLLCVPTLPSLWRDRWLRFAILPLSALAAALAVTTWFQPHYVAPAACLVYLLVIAGLRRLRLWKWRDRCIGRTLVATLPYAYAALLTGFLVLHSFAQHQDWHLARARLMADLYRRGGNHVILVRYGPDHSPHAEWVYNGADVDGSRVIWARDMGASANVRLISYYRKRQIWQLDADADPPIFVPLLTTDN